MKIFRHLFLFVFLTAFQQIQAVTVTTMAGNLEQVLENENLSQLNNLTVNGTMDARDFKFIADELPALQTLNLANATIVEYSANKAVFANYILYEKNVLPQLSLMGTNLRNIVLPNSITTIGEGAFAGCTKLETIEIPANVTTVGNYAFSGCSALTDITGGNNVTNIGDYAFSQCSAMQNVSSNAAKAIGAYAFLNCSQLSDFDFNSSLSVLEEGAFQGTALHSANLSNCGQLTAVGAWAFADTPNLTDVQLPSSVEAIGDGAFFYSTSLHQVNLPSKLTRINDFTFMGGQITDPQLLPESLKGIGNFALAEWTTIEEFLIPSTVTHIGDGAFRNWESLIVLTSDALTPPELGKAVWEGVFQENVTLNVPAASESLYKAAEQWKEFFSSASAISNVKTVLKTKVINDIVYIDSSVSIREASLYDINGVMLSAKQVNGLQTDFDLSSYSGKIYIVRCMMENNRTEFLKIARQ